MQFSHYCILAFLLAIISNVIASDNTTCKLVIDNADLRASETHIRIRGDIDVRTDDCKPTTNKTDDVTSIVNFVAPLNYTFNFTDSANVTHSGNACNITASWYNKPDGFDTTNSTEVFVPIRFINVITCNNDTLPATTTTTTTKTTTTTRRTRRTRSRTTRRTTRRTTHTTTRRTTTRRRTTKKTTKKVSSSSSSSDYSEHFSGTATFFTPNQGACGDWNDDEDLIAAIVSFYLIHFLFSLS